MLGVAPLVGSVASVQASRRSSLSVKLSRAAATRNLQAPFSGRSTWHLCVLGAVSSSVQCLAQSTLPGQPSEGPLEGGKILAFLSLAVVLLHTYSAAVLFGNLMVTKNKAFSLREPAGSRATALFERCDFCNTTRLYPMDAVLR